MKIAYVVYDYEKPGGIEKYVRILAEKATCEHEVHVITTRAISKSTSIKFHLVPVPSFLPYFFRMVLFTRIAENELKKERYDIIHSHGADCRIHNVLTAHSCHKAWVEKAKCYGIWEYLKKVIHPLHAIVLHNERYNYKHIKRGTAVSHEVKNEIMKYYGVSGDLIDVIYPGVEIRDEDLKEKRLRRESIRRAQGINVNDFVLLFVSNEFRRKGLATIINALAVLNDPSIKLLVIGKGNSVPYLLQATARGVRSQVNFTGPTEKVMEYYAAGDLFLLPTKHEAFGMVITEAMSAGLPVIVTRYAGAAELIEDHNCLLDDPLDVQEIAAKVRYFMSNREIAGDTGASLRKVTEKYTWDVMAERTMAVYRSTANKY